jgi:hypothetical protein
VLLVQDSVWQVDSCGSPSFLWPISFPGAISLTVHHGRGLLIVASKQGWVRWSSLSSPLVTGDLLNNFPNTISIRASIDTDYVHLLWLTYANGYQSVKLEYVSLETRLSTRSIILTGDRDYGYGYLVSYEEWYRYTTLVINEDLQQAKVYRGTYSSADLQHAGDAITTGEWQYSTGQGLLYHIDLATHAKTGGGSGFPVSRVWFGDPPPYSLERCRGLEWDWVTGNAHWLCYQHVAGSSANWAIWSTSSWNAGRFDGAAYLAANPAVRDARMDAWLHYSQLGHAEGRDIYLDTGSSGKWDDAAYLMANPDVATAGYTGWDHYKEWGYWQGRTAFLTGGS